MNDVSRLDLEPSKGSPGSEVADHRQSKRAGRSINKLTIPFEAKPTDGSVIEIVEGLFWARIPLPWALDHINVYLADEGDGWTVIDTGAQGQTGKAAWEALFEGPMQGRPVKRVIATHMHPDHLGLAGWLVERFGASFAITAGEYLTASLLWLSASDTFPQSDLDFLWRAGVDRQMEPILQSHGYSGFKKGVHQLPSAYQRLEDGTSLTIGGRAFTVVIGRGHSPEHACLFCRDANLLISGDQILPGITSNVSVFAREPEANSLGHWMSALDRLKGLADYSDAPDQLMVLPSHGRVFQGLTIRLDDLIDGHAEKLVDLAEFLKTPQTAVGSFPAMFSRQLSGLDFFLGLGETIAHLNLLRALGVIERSTPDGQEAYHYKTVGKFSRETLLDDCNALPGIALRPLADVLGAP